MASQLKSASAGAVNVREAKAAAENKQCLKVMIFASRHVLKRAAYRLPSPINSPGSRIGGHDLNLAVQSPMHGASVGDPQ